jgi:hypothetical protein
LYPEATKAFDPCAKIHDEQYKSVDWSLGEDATKDIDVDFFACCCAHSGDNGDLKRDALTFYRACRAWGKMRAGLWKWGVRY